MKHINVWPINNTRINGIKDFHGMDIYVIILNIKILGVDNGLNNVGYYINHISYSRK